MGKRKTLVELLIDNAGTLKTDKGILVRAIPVGRPDYITRVRKLDKGNEINVESIVKKAPQGADAYVLSNRYFCGCMFTNHWPIQYYKIIGS